MDMDDDGVADPTAEFGELFEGQVAFESELGDHDADEMLGSIGNELAMGSSTHHHRSSTHHPSDQDILEANLNFVPDDYLQHQHIVMDSDLGSISGLGGLGDPQNPLQDLEDGPGAEVYIPQPNSQSNQVNVNAEGSIISQNFNQVPETIADQNIQINPPPPPIPPPVVNEGPKVKKKVKVVKDVKYFVNENMERYLNRRGFKMKHGEEDTPKTVNRAVFALSSNSQSKHYKLVSFGSKYEPECITQEVERFWRFYSETKLKHTAISRELLPMLIPMLLHFYFEMILANLFPIARRICYEFSKKFLNEDKTQEHYDVLLAVTKITSAEMLKSDVILSPLLNRRCEFFLSEFTLLYLRRFLSASTNPVLPNLFTRRFKIRARETKELMDSFDWEKMLDLDSDEDSEEYPDEGDCDENEVDDKSDAEMMTEEESCVQDIIDEVRNSVHANLPSISVYTTSHTPVCGAISKQGSLVAFGLQEAGMRLYSVENARDIMKTYSQPDKLADPDTFYGARTLGGHAGTVYGVHFHPRTKLLFSVGQDSFMRAWDLNSDDKSKIRAVYRGHSGPIWKLDIPDSGSMVATCGLDTTARIFLPERTEFVRIMAGHYFSVNAVKFHPNEAYIATGSDDKSARLWSVHDGNMVRMFTGAAGSINCVAYHSSGRYLAGAGEDKKIILWDLAEGEVLATLDCVQNCKDLMFSGNMLAACFRNGILQIFNLRPILGGSESSFDHASSSASINSPFTTQTAAKTLFKVYYKDPGTLYCLGSEIKPSEDTNATSKETACLESKESETINNADDHTLDSSTNSGAHLLQHVLQTHNSTSSATEENNANQAGTSKILASRLSQPLPSSSSSVGTAEEGEVANMILSEGEIGEDPLSVGTSASATAGSTPMISSSELDAAIASVIDQSGGDHSTGGGGGTITMYASS